MSAFVSVATETHHYVLDEQPAGIGLEAWKRMLIAAPRMFELLERLSVCIEKAEQYQLEGEAERLIAEIRGES